MRRSWPLLAQVAAIYEEENALGSAELEKAIGNVDCGKGLPGAI